MSGTQYEPVTVPDFRTHWPAFASTTTYPTPIVQMYLDLANVVLPQSRWCEYWHMGVELYTAHFLTLDARDLQVVNKGGVPGAVGVITSKSVGSVSISYDGNIGTEPGGGHWNSTSYGRRFYRLVLMAGAGPVQVSPRVPGGPAGLVVQPP